MKERMRDAGKFLVCAMAVVACGSGAHGGRSDRAVARGEAVDEACTENGCLRAVRELPADYDSDWTGPLASGVTVIRFSEIDFYTDGMTSQATIAVPSGDLLGPLHVVAFDHGTSGVVDACNPTGHKLARSTAAEYAARGFVGVSVEYPSRDGVAAYMMRDVDVRATLDALRAVRAYAAESDVALSGQNGVIGFSQGAFTALAVESLRSSYAPDVDVRAYAAMAPPILNKPFWSSAFAQVDRALASGADAQTAAVPGMMMYPFLKMYAWRHFFDLEATFVDGADVDTFASACVTDPENPNRAPPILESLPRDPAALFDPTFYAAFRDGRWDSIPRISRVMDDNRLAPYAGSVAVRIYVGSQDHLHAPDEQQAYLAAVRDNPNVSVPPPIDGGHDDVYVTQHRAATDFVAQHFEAPSDGPGDAPGE
jgi:hypothetical protein